MKEKTEGVDLSPWSKEKVEEQIFIQKKYAGYLARQKQVVLKQKKMEDKQVPLEFDYETVPGLPLESRQKFKRILPRTIGQASRIPGVTPSDIGILLVYIERHRRALAGQEKWDSFSFARKDENIIT